MNPPPPVWDGVLRRLSTELPEFALDAWVRPLAVAESDSCLRLKAPNTFHHRRVNERYLHSIRRCVAEEAGRPVDVTLEVGGNPGRRPRPAQRRREHHGRAPCAPAAAREAPAPPPAAPAAAARSAAAPRQATLPRTFDSFVVGPANALAREASLAVAQGRQSGLCPLYLAGPPGSGKSHLAHALVDEARTRGVVRTIYVSAENFTSEFLSCIQRKQTTGFKRRFREECDLLVLEDVQFLEGKATTQLEFFHTLEHLARIGRRVVMTGDRLPREIPRLDPRLSSQMAAGLVAEIELPDRELRRAILREKAARGGVRLPEECLKRLVDSVEGSVRDLEGVLIQLVATASLLKRRIDPELTEEALRKVRAASGDGRLSVRAVIDAVASFFGIAPDELASRSRKRSVLVPRQLSMYLCHHYTEASLSEIGRALGRDHPAVGNAIRVVERAILERAPLRYQVEALVTRLETRDEAPRALKDGDRRPGSR